MQSASSVTLVKFIAYVILKSKVFLIIHMQIDFVQEFDDINVYALSIFFGLVIIMLMKSDPDFVRNNIFADAYAVRNIFVDVNAIHNRSTRSQSLNNLYLPNYSTRRCQKCICFQGTKIWNSISPEIKILSYNRFKICLKNNYYLIILSR